MLVCTVQEGTADTATPAMCDILVYTVWEGTTDTAVPTPPQHGYRFIRNRNRENKKEI